MKSQAKAYFLQVNFVVVENNGKKGCRFETTPISGINELYALSSHLNTDARYKSVSDLLKQVEKSYYDDYKKMGATIYVHSVKVYNKTNTFTDVECQQMMDNAESYFMKNVA